MQDIFNILSTKKLTKKQVETLEKAGHVNHLDIIETSSTFDFIEPIYPNIIFSSFKGCQYGLEALGESAKKHSFLCVGEKSKILLEQKKLTVSLFANYASELTSKMLKTNRYTYITGSKRLNTIPSYLTKNNITFEEIIAYKSVENSKIPKSKQNAILWFSPGGIKAYYNQNKLDLNTIHYCIGKTTKKALQTIEPTIPVSQINSLDKPSRADLIQMVCRNTKLQ
jgi:uroporphyrinogen-III synthase